MPTPTNTQTITLNSVEEIFESPELGILPHIMRAESGLGELEASLALEYPDLTTKSVTFVVNNPSELSPSMLVTKIREYSKNKSGTLGQNVKVTKHWSWVVFRSNLLLLAGVILVGLLLALLFEQIAPGLSALVAAFFGVAAWVTLWGPIELRVYDWLEDKRSEIIYRHIGEMEIKILLPQAQNNLPNHS